MIQNTLPKKSCLITKQEYSLAKYDSGLEPNRTPLRYFKENEYQDNTSSKEQLKNNCLWLMAEHLSSNLYNNGILHAEENLVCHQNEKWTY